MSQRFSRFFLLITMFYLVACSNSSPSGAVTGEILLWHDWSGADAELLNELVNKFSTIHPEMTVVTQSFPADTLQEKFMHSVTSGLGPDLLIGQAAWAQEFADAGLIKAMTKEKVGVNPDEIYLSSALTTLDYDGQLYGLPFSLSTDALCYNKSLLGGHMPAETLSALLEQAVEGKQVALSTEFNQAFWGIKTFGGELFDEKGRVILDQGGFANWLVWLKNAQNMPNITLGNHDDALMQFVDGHAAYYVCNSAEIRTLQQTLGAELVGVAPLPAGPNNPAGPLLNAEALLFSKASDAKQTNIAMNLALFLTNAEQQKKLATEVAKVPANSAARIDNDRFPIVSALMRQSRTAVPIRLSHIQQAETVSLYGQRHYSEALEGVLSVTDAIAKLTSHVNGLHGFGPSYTRPTCPTDQKGILEVWHDWRKEAAEAAALDQLAQNFMQLCPSVLIQINSRQDVFALSQSFDLSELSELSEQFDLLISSTDVFDLMLSQGKIRDITQIVEPEALQQYIPAALEAIRHEEKLYGLPMSVRSMALYYNSDLVSDPPRVLDDLFAQATPERQVALPIGFEAAFWGISAFSGIYGERLIFDDQQRVILDAQRADTDQSPFAEWLSWLKRAQDNPGIVLSDDPNELYDLFVSGKAAYLVGEAELLNEFQVELNSSLPPSMGENLSSALKNLMKKERVRVVPLPVGPRGAAGPFLTVQGLMFNPDAEPEQVNLALAFANYLTNIESQTLLMEQANFIPANVNVDTSDYPAVAGFLEQANTATVQPSIAEIDALLSLGNTVYRDVLNSNIDPQVAVDHFTDLVNEINEFSVEKEAFICEGEGKVLLWHSWPTHQAALLEQNIVEFAQTCPQITVETRHVSANILPTQLAAAVENGTAPDFLLTSHDLIASQAKLLKKITPLIEEKELAQHISSATQAFRYKDARYGLPQSFNSATLYCNLQLTDTCQIDTLDQFLEVTAQAPVAFDTSFVGASWGLNAFGGMLFEDHEKLSADQTAFTAWLKWLQTVSTKGILLSHNQEELQRLFAAGEIAYLVTGSEALSSLQKGVGAENLALSFLPGSFAEEEEGIELIEGRPFTHSLVRVEGFLFTDAVTEEQTASALSYARFASSEASQRAFSKKGKMPPTNKLVIKQEAANETNTHFLSLMEDEFILPHNPHLSTILSAGDTLYQKALIDQQNITRLVDDFVQGVNSGMIQVADTSTQTEIKTSSCDLQGDLLLWHSWSDHRQSLLEEKIQEFTNNCANVKIESRLILADLDTNSTELSARLASAVEEGDAPDLLLTTHDLIVPLAEQGFIQPITPLVSQEQLNQYLPWSIAALQKEEALYGLPQTFDVTSLYQNTQLVTETVSTLDELLVQAAQHPAALIALNSSFNDSFWGISAFDDHEEATAPALFDEQGQLTLNQRALTGWLTWLQRSQSPSASSDTGQTASNAEPVPSQPIILSAKQDELLERFAAAEVGYVTGGVNALTALQAALGAENVAVTPLPAGPSGPARPFVRVEGFLFAAGLSEKQSELALAFAQFATSDKIQSTLAEQANVPPTNNLAITRLNDPALRSFIKQAETGLLLPDVLKMRPLQSAGDIVYTQVLTSTLAANNAFDELIDLIDSKQ